MPQSLASIHVHIVFSTRDRKPFLRHHPEIHAYLAEIANCSGCPAVSVGGVEDHVHLLVRLGRTNSVAELVKELKRASSIWMKRNISHFSWQAGYGAFSVGLSNLEAVETYVLQQAEHHKKVSFVEEYRKFLERHGIEYDERYVWD